MKTSPQNLPIKLDKAIDLYSFIKKGYNLSILNGDLLLAKEGESTSYIVENIKESIDDHQIYFRDLLIRSFPDLVDNFNKLSNTEISDQELTLEEVTPTAPQHLGVSLNMVSPNIQNDLQVPLASSSKLTYTDADINLETFYKSNSQSSSSLIGNNDFTIAEIPLKTNISSGSLDQNNTNSPPLFTVSQKTLILTEDATMTASGKMVPIDGRPNVIYSLDGNSQGQYGVLNIDAQSGQYTYTADNDKLQPLNTGQQYSETFTIMATDNNGMSDKKTITVTIEGADEPISPNNAPVLTLSLAELAITEDATLTASGKASATDADNDQITYHTDQGQGQYGVFSVDPDTGEYTYSAQKDNSEIQALNDGGKLTEVFTIIASDGKGGNNQKTVTVNINGADEPNSPPSLSLTENSFNIIEDRLLIAQGTALATDDKPNVTYSLDGDPQGKYGVLNIDAQSGQFTYTADNDKLQPLNTGQKFSETFMIIATDSDGVSDQKTITVMIEGSDEPRGTNNEPVLTLSLTELAITEDATLTASGKASAADDDNDQITYSTDQGQGLYGIFSVDPDTGEYTYSTQKDNSDIQALNDGGKLTEVFTIIASDGKGGNDQKTVTVNINGADEPNSPPSLSLTEDVFNITEDATLTASGKASATDDKPNITYSLEGNPQGQYGILNINAQSGEYTYTADNDKLQALNTGDLRKEIFTIIATDSDGAIDKKAITVNVNGADENSPPSLSLTENVFNITEDATLTASGKASATDDKPNVTYSLEGNPQGQYGILNINAQSGEYTYTADNDKLQALNTGDLRNEAFTIIATDSDGVIDKKTITVNINGADEPINPNNAPTLDLSKVQLDIIEDTALTASGTAKGSDPDGDSLTYSIENSQGQYGNLSINADTGEYEYTVNNNDIQFLNPNQKVSEDFTIKVTDSAGKTADKTLIVNILGYDKDTSDNSKTLTFDPIGDPQEIEAIHAGTYTTYASFSTTGFFVKKGDVIEIDNHSKVPAEFSIGTPYYSMAEGKPSTAELYQGKNTYTATKNGILYIANRSYNEDDKLSVTIRGATEMPVFKLGVHQSSDLDAMLKKDGPIQFESERAIITTTTVSSLGMFFDITERLQRLDSFIKAEEEIAGLSDDGTGVDRGKYGKYHLVEGLRAGAQAPAYATEDVTVYTGSNPLFYDDSVIIHELGHQMTQLSWALWVDKTTKNIEQTPAIYQLSAVLADPKLNLNDDVAFTSNNPEYSGARYMQLYWAFGKEFYQIFHQETRLLTAAETPRSDADKIAYLVKTMSEISGFNLLPFFDHYNMPIPGDARNQIEAMNLKKLPQNIWEWQPRDYGRGDQLAVFEYKVPQVTEVHHESIIKKGAILGTDVQVGDLINYDKNAIKSAVFVKDTNTSKTDHKFVYIQIEDHEGNINIIPVKVYITPNAIDPNISGIFPADLAANWGQYSTEDRQKYVELATISTSYEAYKFLKDLSNVHISSFNLTQANFDNDVFDTQDANKVIGIQLSKDVLVQLVERGQLKVVINVDDKYYGYIEFNGTTWDKIISFDNARLELIGDNYVIRMNGPTTSQVRFDIVYDGYGNGSIETIQFNQNGIIKSEIDDKTVGAEVTPLAYDAKLLDEDEYNQQRNNDADNQEQEEDAENTTLPQGEEESLSLLLTAAAEEDAIESIEEPLSLLLTTEEDVTESIIPSFSDEKEIFELAQIMHQHQEIDFDPEKAVFDLGDIKIDDLKIYEDDNSTILELPSTDQTYILKDVSLDELEASNFTSSDLQVTQMLDNIFDPFSGFNT